jgi:hypothetical protein
MQEKAHHEKEARKDPKFSKSSDHNLVGAIIGLRRIKTLSTNNLSRNRAKRYQYYIPSY